MKLNTIREVVRVLSIDREGKYGILFQIGAFQTFFRLDSNITEVNSKCGGRYSEEI